MFIFYQYHDSKLCCRADKLKIARELGYKYTTQAYADLYRSGMSASEIADIFRGSKTGVNLALKRMGIKLRGRGGKQTTK